MSRSGLPLWFVAYRDERGRALSRAAFSVEEARRVAGRRSGQVYRRINLRTAPGGRMVWDEAPLPLTLERAS